MHATVQQPCTVRGCTVVCTVISSIQSDRNRSNVNELPEWSNLGWPFEYRLETRIFEETTFSIMFLQMVASLLRTNDLHPELMIEDRAEEMRSESTERKLQGLFALNCPELRSILAKINEQSERLVTPASGQPGRLVHIVHGVHPILRGNLEIIETISLAMVERSPAVAYFLKIFDDDNILDRDNDGVGWHYHYCKPTGARSDTLLAFDTRQPDCLDDKGRVHNVPLFWERHAEGRAKFKAKASLWGDDKRLNVRNAVSSELKRPLNEFRRPSAEASPVWPRNAVLSPQPQSYSPR